MFDMMESLLKDSAFQANVKFKELTFKANQKILEQGKEHVSMYLIKQGKVRVIVSADTKEESLVRPGVAELNKNDVFGEFGLFEDLPASADVIAVEETTLIEIDIPSFRRYLENNPNIGYQVLVDLFKTLISRLRHANKSIFTIYSWGIKA